MICRLTRWLVATLVVAGVLIGCGGADNAPRPKGEGNLHDQCRAEIYSDYIGQFLNDRHTKDIQPATIAGVDRYYDYRGRPEDPIVIVDRTGLGGYGDAIGTQIVDIYCGAH